MSRLKPQAPAKRHALITGASRGIGVHIAKRCAREGISLSLVARDREGLEETAEFARHFGVEVETFPTDLLGRSGLEATVEAVLRHAGAVDILVNNAGTYAPGRLEEREALSLEREIALNLVSAMHLTRLLLPGMRERRFGRIVNIASLAGLVGASYSEVYCASKHGLVGFTRALRASLIQDGLDTIHAVAICPGYISDTGMFKDIQDAHSVRAPSWMGTSHPDKVADSVMKAIDGDNSPEVIVNQGPMRLGLSLMTAFPRLAERVFMKLGAHRTLAPVLERMTPADHQ